MLRRHSPRTLGWGRLLGLGAVLPVLCLTILMGCSKKSDSTAAAQHPSRPGGDEQVPGVLDGGYQPAEPAPRATASPNLPRANLSTSDAQYVPITSGAQLMFLYQAFSGLPPDLEKTATEYSKEYAGTGDAFRRHDLMEALKPKINAMREDARSHPYIRWDQDYTHVDHYDFARKGFLIKDPMLQEGGYGYMADIRGYNLHFTNGEAVSFAPVNDESRARELEALLQKNNLPIRFYAFVQSADDRGDHLVHAHLTKVQVLDRAGNIVLESKAAE